MPQIICPYCGRKINMERRREVDYTLILNALKSGPKRFTELYKTTELPRKTLSFRLKDLLQGKYIIKENGYYFLNRTHLSNNKKFLEVKKLHVLKSNIRIIVLLMLWLVPAATVAYALLIKTGTVKVSPQIPMASFDITPNPQPNTGWEVEGSKIIAGKTVVWFNASGSYDPDGTITEFIWNFGDGEQGEGVTASHVYSKPGRYCVKLTVIDDGGNKGEKYNEVVVYAEPKSEIYLDVESNGNCMVVFIAVRNIENLFGWQAGLRFNPKALKCLTVEKGSSPPRETYNATYVYAEGLFSSSDGLTLWFAPTIDNENGIISPMGCTLLGESPPTSGSGILAKITFEVLSNHSFDFELYDVILSTSNGEEIPVNVIRS